MKLEILFFAKSLCWSKFIQPNPCCPLFSFSELLSVQVIWRHYVIQGLISFNRFNLGSESPAEHLLGHLSIILDMVSTLSNLVTSFIVIILF